jgi:ankyrin repeat protein
VETAKLLIERGAGVEFLSTVGKSPLHRACEYGHTETVKLLLGHSADSTRRDELCRSPLHYAAMSKNMVRVVIYMLLAMICVMLD